MPMISPGAFLACAGLAMLCGMSSAQAEPADEIWRVVEGDGGTTTGTWYVQRDGNRYTGTAKMVKTNGGPLTYQIAGEKKGGQLVVNRFRSSDRVECQYLGSREEEEGQMSGTTMCGAISSVWHVQVLSRKSGSD